MIELSKYDLTSIISDLNQDVSAKKPAPGFEFSDVLSDSLDLAQKAQSGKEVPVSGHADGSLDSEERVDQEYLGKNNRWSESEILAAHSEKALEMDFLGNFGNPISSVKSLSNASKNLSDSDPELLIDKKEMEVKDLSSQETLSLKQSSLSSHLSTIPPKLGFEEAASYEIFSGKDLRDSRAQLGAKHVKGLDSSIAMMHLGKPFDRQASGQIHQNFETELPNSAILDKSIRTKELVPLVEDKAEAGKLNVVLPDKKAALSSEALPNLKDSKKQAYAGYNGSVMQGRDGTTHGKDTLKSNRASDIQNFITKDVHAKKFSGVAQEDHADMNKNRLTQNHVEGSSKQHYSPEIRANVNQLREQVSGSSVQQRAYNSELSIGKEGLGQNIEGSKQKPDGVSSDLELVNKAQSQRPNKQESESIPRSAHIETLSGERKILVGNSSVVQRQTERYEQGNKRNLSLRSDARKYMEPNSSRRDQYSKPSVPIQHGSIKAEFAVEQVSKSNDFVSGVELSERLPSDTDQKFLHQEVRYRQELPPFRVPLPEIEIDLTHLKVTSKANVQSIIEQRIESEIVKFQSQLRVGVLHDLKIKLYPQELGLINLNIELVDNGDINVKIISATDEASKLIRENWSSHLQDMNTKGLAVEFSEKNPSQSKAGSDQGSASDASENKPGGEIDSSETETKVEVADDDINVHSIDITI